MNWATSDYHLNHKKICEYCSRPFKTLEDMNCELINQTNTYVLPDHKLYFLGDFAMGPKELHKGFLDQINCKNIELIVGNHDSKKTQALFPVTHKRHEARIKGTLFCMNHYAQITWPEMEEGSIHLYGHSHAAAEENLDKLFPERRSMDVGVDNAYRLLGVYRPFSFGEIIDILSSRKGYSVDHHVKLKQCKLCNKMFDTLYGRQQVCLACYTSKA